MFVTCIFALCFAAGCVTTNSVVSSTYDFSQLKRIGILSFDANYDTINGVENIFAKYLMQNGFVVVERAKIDAVLAEHKISSQGYLSAQTTKLIGEILGVDALLMGEVFSYSPERRDVKMVRKTITYEEPVYKTEIRVDDKGNKTSHSVRAGTNVRRENKSEPQVMTIYAEVGVTAKLVDVETAEIVYIGSYTDSGANAMSAVEYSAKSLMNDLRKAVDKALTGKK